MCIYNSLCQENEEMCMCKYDFAIKMIIATYPNICYSYNSSIILQYFIQSCEAQTETIKYLYNVISEILDTFSAEPQKSVPNLIVNKSDVSYSTTSKSELINLLCKGENNQAFSLQLNYDIPKPIYKDRFFKIGAKIVDNFGKDVELPNRICIRLALFTKDSPPKQLILAATGEKILRGTIETQGNSTFVFNKVAIQNVSSHYLSGTLFLVAIPEDLFLIKPMIIEDIIIKARKMKEDILIKKRKLEDSYDEDD
ncbi:hypothetical protein SteCoe_12620 [Stentor coeruleus]|uniref:Uncharacterized protein n=1 Tax=Stentor coeruleus TaxID=5963 RepID=A0A1R2CAG0_9CILI|nr:hypothetical protein SteCoe_12620 [Stentor coeruleus]